MMQSLGSIKIEPTITLGNIVSLAVFAVGVFWGFIKHLRALDRVNGYMKANTRAMEHFDERFKSFDTRFEELQRELIHAVERLIRIETIVEERTRPKPHESGGVG